MHTTAATTATNAASAKNLYSSSNDYRLSFGRLVRSEWIKLTTLKSTWWSVAIVAAMTLGFSMLMVYASQQWEDSSANVGLITASLQFSMLMAGVMGAISITGEYSTGMSRSTFTAAPRRVAVVFAKALVLSIFMILVGVVIFGVTTLVVNPMFKVGLDFGSFSETWAPLIWAVVSLAFFALIGLSFGFLVRNGAGAITLTVGLIFILPIVLAMFQIEDPAWAWIWDIADYLPMSIAQTLATTGEGAISDLNAALGMLGWIVAGLGASAIAVNSRDV